MRSVVGCVLLAACFAKPAPPISTDGGNIPDSPARACTSFGAWGQPYALDELNSAVDDFAPSLSGDNSRIVFHSVRNSGNNEAFEAVWNADLARFDAPVPLGLYEFRGGPTLSYDAKTIWYTYFTSTFDIATVTRDTYAMPFAAANVSRFDPFGTTGAGEKDIAFSADMLEAVLIRGDADYEVYIASRPNTQMAFAEPVPVAAAANPTDYDCCPTLSPDGLTLLWEGTRSGVYRVYQVTRPDRGSAFTNVQVFAPLDDSFPNGDPQFSLDGTRLVYASERGSNNYNLYLMRRDCLD